MDANLIAQRKFYKLFIGGRLIESESGRHLTAYSAGGDAMNEYSHASGKDVHEAITAARRASNDWAATPVSLRGKTLARIAEILKGRVEELATVVSRSHGVTIEQARNGVGKVIARILHYAEGAGQGTAMATEPVGVVIILAPDIPVLLPMVSLLLPAIVGGNTTVVLPSERAPLPALTLAEFLSICELPAGVVNILAGKRAELVPDIASSREINAIVDGCAVSGLSSQLRDGALANGPRYVGRDLAESDWFTAKAEDPRWIVDTCEMG